MAFGYVAVDRDQQFLLPPSLRDWLPENHLAWFVLEVVERIDTSPLHARHHNDGPGRSAYDPDMMLALLIYSYCGGVRSSRQIERLCRVDAAYRVICANLVPDHTTIARFRQNHQDHAVALFTEVLMLCSEVGLATVGVVAVDGTKMGADASRKKNRRREWIEAEVAKMFGEADEVDREQDAAGGEGRGDELPGVLRGRAERRRRLDEALATLDRERRAREQRAEAAYRDAVAGAARGENPRRGPRKGRDVERAEAALARARDRAERRRATIEAAAAERGRKPGGPAPRGGRVAYVEARLRAAQHKERAAEDKAGAVGPSDRGTDHEPRANITDPDSRLMKAPGGWVQGYNAQAAVNTNGVILAGEVTQDHNDVWQCLPMIAATKANLDRVGVKEPVGVMLFDAGYLSEANIATDGPDRLIATANAWKLKRTDPTSGPPPEEATPIGAMDHRLRTPEGAAIYALRQHTVEPVFGTIKEQRGFRHFTRRGLQAVKAEWQFITTAHNLRKLFDHQLKLA